MSENRLPDYLQHMQQAAADAVGFVEGMNREDFLSDKRTQQAVVMSLIVLGEAATKVMDRYPDFANAQTQIPTCAASTAPRPSWSGCWAGVWSWWSRAQCATPTYWPASTATANLFMQRDPHAFLWDVREAAQAIQSFTAGLDVKGYVSNELVQAAVERKFEVVMHGASYVGNGAAALMHCGTPCA